MRLIDETYTQCPFYGARRMSAHLGREGYCIGRKRAGKLMRTMGLEACYPKPNLSIPNKENKIFPYLLRDVEITQVDQVWSTDITYVRLFHGFVYLVAIIDWYSRYVLGWSISPSLEAGFCVETLENALLKGKCDIFNTDQGSQFTSKEFTNTLLLADIEISMDGRGRALDNVFVERLWRSVKYECIYLREFMTVAEVKEAIKKYFLFYNNERPHQSLKYKTPAEVYFGKLI